LLASITMSLLSSFSEDLLVRIFLFLNHADVKNMGTVSKYWKRSTSHTMMKLLPFTNVQTFKPHNDSVNCVALLDQSLVTGSDDKSVKLWEITPKYLVGQLLVIFEGHERPVRSLQHIKGTTFLASGGEDQEIRIWDSSVPDAASLPSPAERTAKWVLLGHQSSVEALGYVAGKLMSGARDGKVRIWDTSSWTCEREITTSLFLKCIEVLNQGGLTEEVESIKPDSQPAVQIQDIKNNSLISSITVIDPSTLAIGYTDGMIKIWDTRVPKCIRSIKAHGPSTLCVSKWNNLLASGSCDHQIKLWNANGECVVEWKAHDGFIMGLACDPWCIISVCEDGSLCVWQMRRSGDLLR